MVCLSNPKNLNLDLWKLTEKWELTEEVSPWTSTLPGWSPSYYSHHCLELSYLTMWIVQMWGKHSTFPIPCRPGFSAWMKVLIISANLKAPSGSILFSEGSTEFLSIRETLMDVCLSMELEDGLRTWDGSRWVLGDLGSLTDKSQGWFQFMMDSTWWASTVWDIWLLSGTEKQQPTW